MFDRLAARLTAHTYELRERIRREPDAGYSTEAIVVTAVMVGLALMALGIWGPKVLAKIRGVTL